MPGLKTLPVMLQLALTLAAVPLCHGEDFARLPAHCPTAEKPDPRAAALQTRGKVRVEGQEAINLATIWRDALAGDALAQQRLGELLQTGRLEAPRLPAAAAFWSQCAAEQGQARAAFNLALQNWHGDGIPRDTTAAVKWANQAVQDEAALGPQIGYAQQLLANAYLEGEGVQRDPQQGIHWMQRGAASGNAQLQSALGLRLMTGEDVPRNFSLARELIVTAAQAGERYAVKNLELLDSCRQEGSCCAIALGPNALRPANDEPTRAERSKLAAEIVTLRGTIQDFQADAKLGAELRQRAKPLLAEVAKQLLTSLQRQHLLSPDGDQQARLARLPDAIIDALESFNVSTGVMQSAKPENMALAYAQWLSRDELRFLRQRYAAAVRPTAANESPLQALREVGEIRRVMSVCSFADSVLSAFERKPLQVCSSGEGFQQLQTQYQQQLQALQVRLQQAYPLLYQQGPNNEPVVREQAILEEYRACLASLTRDPAAFEEMGQKLLESISGK